MIDYITGLIFTHYVILDNQWRIQNGVESSSSNEQDINKSVWCAFIISDNKVTMDTRYLSAFCGALQLQIIIFLLQLAWNSPSHFLMIR